MNDSENNFIGIFDGKLNELELFEAVAEQLEKDLHLSQNGLYAASTHHQKIWDNYVGAPLKHMRTDCAHFKLELKLFTLSSAYCYYWNTKTDNPGYLQRISVNHEYISHIPSNGHWSRV
jgi:hypothetical protein